MVEIRNKINNELVGSGVIVLENKEEIKLHTSSKIYKKRNVISCNNINVFKLQIIKELYKLQIRKH